MMGRPPLPVGTFGKIGFVEQPGGMVQARARFRDYDGQTRLVSKIGRSRAAAERALKKELANRQPPAGDGAITASMRLAVLADLWLQAPHGWSTGTERTYRSVVRNQVKPALGQLCVREVTPGVVSRALSAIARSSGPGAAKSARACLSGMFALAIQDGAITANPVRDSVARISVGKKAPRALTPDETAQLIALFASSTRATRARPGRPRRLDARHRMSHRRGARAAVRSRMRMAGRCSTWMQVRGRSTRLSCGCPSGADRPIASEDGRRLARCRAAAVRGADGGAPTAPGQHRIHCAPRRRVA